MGYYSSTLQKGSKGDETKKWQEFLNSQGYGLSVDGDFGDKTYNATIDWQTKNGLTADGIVGANTWGKAGFKNMNTPVSAPTTNPMPTNPTYDSTLWDDTAKGQAALGAYTDAKDAVSGFGDFNFSQNDWLENVKQGIQNYGQFSYNVNEDALYQQAVERYKQMGNLAMQDTMGQAAAMTGGYGNSYAQSAGQQAYQSYLQEASDMLPEYYQMALDRYNMGKEDLYNQYGMLMSEYEREYGLHSDEYNKLLDQLGIAKDDYYSGADMHYTEQSNKNNIAGQEFTDAMNIWNAETEQDWKQAAWDEDARRRAEDLAWEQKVYEESMVTPNGSNDDNGGNDKDKTKDEGTEVQIPPFVGTSYGQAVEYAKEYGVPAGVASNIMDKATWYRKKNSGQTTAEVANYSTYQEYLADITAYLIETYSNR